MRIRSNVELEVLFEVAYKCDYEPGSDSKKNALKYWQQQGMMEIDITSEKITSKNLLGKQFRLTSKGQYYLEALKSLPLPVEEITFRIPAGCKNNG